MPGDQIIRCAECGVAFVWTGSEQQTDAARPTRCPACRRLAPAEGRQRGLVEGQPLPRAGQLVEFSVGHGSRGAQAEALVVLEAE